jgi:hypothetical protein
MGRKAFERKYGVTEEELLEFLADNPEMDECIDCIECDDASRITLEDY